METPYAEIVTPLAFSVTVVISAVSTVGEAYWNMMERLLLQPSSHVGLTVLR